MLTIKTMDICMILTQTTSHTESTIFLITSRDQLPVLRFLHDIKVNENLALALSRHFIDRP